MADKNKEAEQPFYKAENHQFYYFFQKWASDQESHGGTIFCRPAMSYVNSKYYPRDGYRLKKEDLGPHKIIVDVIRVSWKVANEVFAKKAVPTTESFLSEVHKRLTGEPWVSKSKTKAKIETKPKAETKPKSKKASRPKKKKVAPNAGSCLPK